MITRTLYLLTFAGGLTAALVAGCGGKVIVDGVGNEGGQGSQETSTSSGSGGSDCGFPAPVGSVRVCGGTGNGTPGSASCDIALCDEYGNRYEANCTDTSCLCWFSPSTKSPGSSCTCTLPSSCLSATPCCPFIPGFHFR